MGIIIKFILTNIKEKKFRTFLIIFSVSLSAALFFASYALTGTIESTFMQRMKKYIGTAEIVVEPNAKSPYWLFRMRRMSKDENCFEYAVGIVESSGIYKNKQESVNIGLKGLYLADLKKFNPYILEQQRNLWPFTGNKIIVSQNTARNYHFKVGENIELLMNETRHRFQIVGIARPLGYFQEDGQSNTAVVPREVLAGMFNAPGAVSKIYLKLKEPAQIEIVIKDLAREYRRYTVRESISKAEVNRYTQAVTVPFKVMVILVLFISVFIIYSSFKVITRERLPVIGTFRSIGATKRMTDLVLLAESIVYGVIGGFIGCGLGIGILYIMSALITPDWMAGSAPSIDFSIFQLLGAFMLAVILPLIGSFLPIIRTAKIPIKEIILNIMEKPKKQGNKRLYMGVACLIFAGGAPFLAPREWALFIDVACMLAAVAATVILIPFLTASFLKLFERIYDYLLGNEGVLAAKNLRENKSILNNISLLAIGISSLLMINTVSFSVIKEIANFYKDGTFEIWLGWYPQSDRRLEGIIRSVDGVKSTYGMYAANFVEIAGSKEKINLINGINTGRYLDFWNVTIDGGPRALHQLDTNRNILVSSLLKDKLAIEKGDLLTLKMKRGNRTYKVVGYFNSLMWGGSYALIADRYFKIDNQEHYYSDILIKTTKDPDYVLEKIKKKFKRYRPWVQTMKQMSKQELQSEGQLFLILQGFAVMTLIIGVFGVFNNLIISFIERKRSLAMMRSLGMSARQTLKMIFIESLTGGIIGGTVGILTGTLLIALMPFLMRAINQVAPIHYSLREYIIALAAGVMIMVVASIGPAFKSSKINIIDAIKYE